MRVLVTCLILAASAAPAAAQDYLGLALARDAERVAAEQAARHRDIVIGNELSRLDAQVQTNQALAGLAAQRAPVYLPAVRANPNAPPPMIDVSKLASIPDAALAESNAKVRAASQNRR
ncbi:MAG TPA: hypothetical protein VGC92_05935 [Phenylobacterium sp.]|jgi:hypothetical protein